MRLRILPILILSAVTMLGLRLGEIWYGFGGIAEAQSQAASDFVEDPFSDVQLAQAEAEGQGADSEDAAADKAAEGGAGAEGAAAAGERTAVATAPSDGAAVDPLEMSDAEIEILQQLSKRRQELDRREAELEQRESLLKAAETRLKQDIARLKTLKSEIEGLLVSYNEQEDRQLRRLVKIYEKMKADDAARIFGNLDMDILLQVVDQMNERKTAPILAEMDPAKAQELTLELAKRKDLPNPEKD